MTKRRPFFTGYRPQFYFRTEADEAVIRDLLHGLPECARCGRNKPVPGYDWCAECRPELKTKGERKDDGN